MDQKKLSKKNNFLKDVLTIAILTIFIVLPIRLVVAQPFIVSGSSMLPTFENSDYLIVDQVTYRIEEPKRYDVIVFKYPNDPSKFFIKRIMGLPGEFIKSEKEIISIKKDSSSEWKILEESFEIIKSKEKRKDFSYKLKEDEYFVIGDNRKASSDSRVWGALNKDLIIGRAFIRLLPITKIDLLPGSVK